MLAASKVKISGSEEKEVNRNAYDISYIKRVLEGFWKFLVVVVQTTAKKCTKKVCCTCKVVFLLIRPTDVLGCFGCRRRLELHEPWINLFSKIQLVVYY